MIYLLSWGASIAANSSAARHQAVMPPVGVSVFINNSRPDPFKEVTIFGFAGHSIFPFKRGLYRVCRTALITFIDAAIANGEGRIKALTAASANSPSCALSESIIAATSSLPNASSPAWFLATRFLVRLL